MPKGIGTYTVEDLQRELNGASDNGKEIPSLPLNKEKELLERYCKQLLDTALLAAEVDDSVVSYANLIEQKNKHIDLLSVKKVSGLIFSAEAEAWLLRLFHETKE